MFCINYFNSGQNQLNVKFESKVRSLTLKLDFTNCEIMCQLYFKIEVHATLVSQERSNIWIFICISIDHSMQEISLGLGSKIVLQTILENQKVEAASYVQTVKMW